MKQILLAHEGKPTQNSVNRIIEFLLPETDPEDITAKKVIELIDNVLKDANLQHRNPFADRDQRGVLRMIQDPYEHLHEPRNAARLEIVKQCHLLHRGKAFKDANYTFFPRSNKWDSKDKPVHAVVTETKYKVRLQDKLFMTINFVSISLRFSAYREEISYLFLLYKW